MGSATAAGAGVSGGTECRLLAQLGQLCGSPAGSRAQVQSRRGKSKPGQLDPTGLHRSLEREAVRAPEGPQTLTRVCLSRQIHLGRLLAISRPCFAERWAPVYSCFQSPEMTPLPSFSILNYIQTESLLGGLSPGPWRRCSRHRAFSLGARVQPRGSLRTPPSPPGSHACRRRTSPRVRTPAWSLEAACTCGFI